MSEVTSKSGLYYRDNFHTLIGIDVDDSSFTGRVPFGVHTIEDNVFASSPYESFSIPDSVKQVGFNLFENCGNAVSVRLPSGLSELTPYMFSGCKKLTRVTMPNVVTEFPEGLFMNCESLPEVPFRTDIAYIGAKSFLGCSSLTNVVFPDTVQIIEHQAFALCTSIESIVVGPNVSEIADDSFAGCTSLCHVRLAEENEYFSLNEDGNVVRKSDGKVVISIAASQKTSVSFLENENSDEKLAVWIDSDDEGAEEDDTFSAEIGAGDEESISMGVEPANSKPVENSAMVSSIMNQNSVTEEVKTNGSVAVSMDELASVVDTMNASNGTYTEDAAERKAHDKNLKILCENVGFSDIVNFPSKGLPATTPDLFVFAEELVQTPDGGKSVTPKLKKCCEAIANIHDLKKIVYLSELPVDNDEFIMFLANTLKRQHVLVACTAANPENLSDYSKKVCQAAQISLNRNEVLDQRKKAGIKNPGTIKLIVQDKL